MSAEPADEAARRFAAGPPPSSYLSGHGPDQTVPTPEGPKPFDPLRLCIFTTVALLGWVFGPLALAVFSGVAFAGYWRARRAGLTRSRCYLRDTRLVLTYLAVLFLVGVGGSVWWGLRQVGVLP